MPLYARSVLADNAALRSAIRIGAIDHAELVITEPASSARATERSQLARAILNGDANRHRAIGQVVSAIVSRNEGFTRTSIAPDGTIDPYKFNDSIIMNAIQSSWTQVALDTYQDAPEGRSPDPAPPTGIPLSPPNAEGRPTFET